jgi:hypothetical protein
VDDERSAFYKRLESAATSASSLWKFGRYADLALLRAKIPTGPPPPSHDLFFFFAKSNDAIHLPAFFFCRLYTRTYNAFERALSLAMLCL